MFRALNPDREIWSDPQTFLAMKIANAVEDIKYLLAAPLPWTDGEMPERYWPAQYGPKTESADKASEKTEAAHRAVQGAADLRAELWAETTA